MPFEVRGRTFNYSSVLLSVAAVGLAFEIGLRMLAGLSAAQGGDAGSVVPLHIAVESPELFRLNPEHPGINSQALRDRETPFLKPLGTRRILVLGDSVTFGPEVADERIFTARLEARLAAAGVPAEVINAGVPGYSPYNQLHYYRSRGQHFDPDVVVVVFCVDDVANPRLHWRPYIATDAVPKAAIPNPRYDRDIIQPRIALESSSRSLFESSYVLRALHRRIEWFRPEGAPDADAVPPIYITPEDDIRIEVLADDRSAEWQWLVRFYERMQTAVESGGAKFVVAVAPVASRIDEGNGVDASPVMPNFERFCEERSIPCIDLSIAMSGHEREEVFLADGFGSYDAWNLSAAGHELVAIRLAEFFAGRPDLLERAATN